MSTAALFAVSAVTTATGGLATMWRGAAARVSDAVEGHFRHCVEDAASLNRIEDRYAR